MKLRQSCSKWAFKSNLFCLLNNVAFVKQFVILLGLIWPCVAYCGLM